MRCFEGELGVAGREREAVVADVVEHVGVVRGDDELLGHLVAERALLGLDLHDVAHLHLVDVVERGPQVVRWPAMAALPA